MQDKAITRRIMGKLGGQTMISLQKQPRRLSEETGVQLLYAASYDIWCRYLDTDQASTDQNCAAQTKMERCVLNITYKDIETNIWPGRGQQSYRHDQQCEEKSEVVLGRAHPPPQRRPMNLTCHHLKRRQWRPAINDGETTLTNNGGTRSGRGQRNTCQTCSIRCKNIPL